MPAIKKLKTIVSSPVSKTRKAAFASKASAVAAVQYKKPAVDATSKKTTSGSNANQQSYLDMIVHAIDSLEEKTGSSRAAILKYVMANFDVGQDIDKVNTRIKQALKRGTENNILVNSTEVNTPL